MDKEQKIEQRRNKIIELSDEILLFLLEYRNNNEDFVFHLRQRESSSSKEPRLANGFWFQGSSYIWFSPYNQGDDFNKTRSIGFVIEFDKNNQPRFSKQMAFGGNDNAQIVEFYRELASKWFGDNINKTLFKYKQPYTNLNLIEALQKFLNVDKPIIDDLIIKHGHNDRFFWNKEDFEKQLNKTLIRRNELKELTEVLIPENELEGEEGEVKCELKWHKKRERDKKFVRMYKAKYSEISNCPACDIDIKRIYGLKPIQVLELHHILPFSKTVTKINQKLKEEDVILLCPTCHRVIHKIMSKNRIDKITLEEFKTYLT